MPSEGVSLINHCPNWYVTADGVVSIPLDIDGATKSLYVGAPPDPGSFDSPRGNAHGASVPSTPPPHGIALMDVANPAVPDTPPKCLSFCGEGERGVVVEHMRERDKVSCSISASKGKALKAKDKQGKGSAMLFKHSAEPFGAWVANQVRACTVLDDIVNEVPANSFATEARGPRPRPNIEAFRRR